MSSKSWPYVKLGTLADFKNGLNFSKENWGKGLKVIGVADFKDYLYPIYETLEEINPEGVVREQDYLQENDILFVRSNGNRELIGRSLFLKGLRERISHSGFTIRLRFLSKQVHVPFYVYLFRSSLIRAALSLAGGGTNINNLNQAILGNLDVPLPPLQAQYRIASILSSYDDLIENNKSRIAILEKMAEEIYREWFVRMRFPGSPLCKQSGRNSTKAKFSKGRPLLWQTLRVKDVVDRLRFGRIYRQEELSDDGKVVVIDQSTADQLGYYDGEPSHCATAEKPILLFGDHSCKMVFMTRPFSLAENVIPFRPAKGLSAYFLFHLIKGLATTTEYKRHWTELMNREVLLPTSDLQFEYEKVIITTHEQIGLLKGLNKILSKSRDILLPRLISGKLSVEDLELPSNEKLTAVSSALPQQELAHA